MTEKTFIEMQTAVNSPIRRSQDKIEVVSSHSQFHLFVTRPSTERMSLTQKEIYSHDLIRELMEKRNKKSIQHNVNSIDKELSLSARPNKTNKNEFNFDSIPPENKMYSSQCYAKINQIKTGLRDSKNEKDKVRQQKNEKKCRPLSAAAKLDTYNPKVSVKGLVNYNFKTVNARKSLGFNTVNHEQKLVEKLMAASQKQYCSIQRRDKIMGKSSGARFFKYKQNQQAILKDFTSGTESYLTEVLLENEQNTLIYNEREKKLNFIKEYMQQQGVDYEEAASIVTQIEGVKKKNEAKAEHKMKEDANNEVFLEGRRMPKQRKPLLVRHFLFIE